MGKGANFSSPLRVDGVTVVDEGGNIIGDITAGAGSIGTTEIADNAITTAKLAAEAVETAKIKKGSVTLELLDESIAPAFVVKFAGQHTTAGGDANETATVTGVLATDIVIATIEDNGANNVTLLQAAVAANAVNFTLSANPGTDCIINYMVLRNTMLQ